MTRRELFSSAAAPLLARWERPNIVLILADDLGWGDVGMNGCSDIRTPHIDGIARAGVRFTQFYASAPECTPTRCALLTGRYPHRVGGLECAIGVNNIGRYDEAAWLQQRGELGLPASEVTIGRVLKSAGYATACTGKWHLGYDPKFWPDRHGFDYSFTLLGGGADYYTHMEMNEGAGQKHLYENGRLVNEPGRLTNLFANRAIRWLKQIPKGQPFFLYLPFTAPHAPIQNPADFDPAAGTAPHRNRHRPSFAAVVEDLDRAIGTVLDQLEMSGATRNTLVIFTSDNGGDANGRNLPFRGAKSSVYEGGIRVACCMRWPQRIRPGQTASQPAMSMDLFPTILHAARVKAPAGRESDGMNLLPVLEGKSAPRQRTLFWRYKRAKARRKAVRDGDWKYTNDSGSEGLYNLATDERESENLIGKQEAIAAKLREKLAAWEAEVEAPRLRGFSATG